MTTTPQPPALEIVETIFDSGVPIAYDRKRSFTSSTPLAPSKRTSHSDSIHCTISGSSEVSQAPMGRRGD